MSKGKDRYELVGQNEVDKVLHLIKPVLGKLNKYMNEHDRDCLFDRQIVGSVGRGVVSRIRNGNQGFDIDINLVINYPGDGYTYKGKNVHDLFLNGLRQAVKNTPFSDPEESSSVFTLKCVDHKNSKVVYGVDLAIIYYDPNGDMHFLQYNKSNGGFGFQVRPLPRDLDEMKEYIINYYQDGEKVIADSYIHNKNANYDSNKHSFIIYVETICNIYNHILQIEEDDEDDYWDD